MLLKAMIDLFRVLVNTIVGSNELEEAKIPVRQQVIDLGAFHIGF
jgi:hypothetical protein